ncbi:hypothetical protein FHG87_023311 [Trinorchestia longiramus]|nr:hypothetical protein FHG87_023311 [Trinorchestia longiramus]
MHFFIRLTYGDSLKQGTLAACASGPTNRQGHDHILSGLPQGNVLSSLLFMVYISVSQSGPYRPPGGVEEMKGGGRRVRIEWGAYITV